MGVGFGAHGQAMAAGAGVTIKNSACITAVRRLERVIGHQVNRVMHHSKEDEKCDCVA